jgi:tetratricopeptide (TPR) repeat protein
MTTSRHHSDTEARPSGLDGRIQDLLEWVTAHGREFVIGLGVLAAAAVVLAIVWESARSRRADALTEWAKIEAAFAAEMGSEPTATLVAEPANPEQAKAAREAALAKYEAFAQSHSGSDLAANALLRAAELEVDLGRLDAADARLQALVAQLDGDDPRKGVALRLRGYVLEELGRPDQAAEAYEAGGALESYPPRALLWLAAARTHMRLGANERALQALDEAVAAEPELASDAAIERERKILQAALARSAAPAPPPAETR